MKIVVATDDFIHVSGHVGRCAGFLQFEINNGEIVSRIEIENNFTNHSQNKHGDHEHENGHDHHGHSHASLAEALKENDVLISKGMGKRLIDDLTAQGIKTVITDELLCDEAALLYEKGELNILDNAFCNH